MAVKLTPSISAALFKSRTPSSASLIRCMNFFVSNPEEQEHITKNDATRKVKYTLSENSILPRELS